MIIEINDDLDLDKIADSGQCFRWEKITPKAEPHGLRENDNRSDTYRIIAGSSCLYITGPGRQFNETGRAAADRSCHRYEIDCSEEDYKRFWRDYFDLNEDYKRIRERIDPEQDPFLWAAAEQEKGIRILRQDPWEMLITFIISQNRNIPAIRRSVELISEICGEKRSDSRGRQYFAFPDAAAVAALTEKELSDCKLGYRCKYVHAAAEAVAGGSIDLDRLRRADEASAAAALTGLFGVGVKVASCVSLFGLHHTDAFPVDVWMKRVLAKQYPEGYPFDRYSPYNGVYQQYMFAYYRKKGTK